MTHGAQCIVNLLFDISVIIGREWGSGAGLYFVAPLRKSTPNTNNLKIYYLGKVRFYEINSSNFVGDLG